ncbi:MAG: HD domain-containing protein [Spirochaetales bacterium]|nr:HD domain-containing protein [Spirochaetales bacterium]
MTRDEAVSLWKKYNDSESLYIHALSVEAVMRKAAVKYGEDPEYWGIVGFLHDLDWGHFPEEHCKKAPELLKEAGATDEMIHAIVSHGYGLCCDVKPELFMEKMLYTIDELSGLVNATALMRPEKLKGISVKSVKKKWKDKGFAAGVNREVITQGCQMLELSQEEIIQLVIDGMTDVAPQLGLWD